MKATKRDRKSAIILAVLALAGGLYHLSRGLDYLMGGYAILLGASLLLPRAKAAWALRGTALGYAAVMLVRLLRTPEVNLVRIIPELAAIVGVALIFVNLRRPEALRGTALAFAVLVPIADVLVSATLLLVDNMNGTGGSAGVMAGLVPLATRLICDGMVAVAMFVATALDAQGKLTEPEEESRR